MLFKLYCLLKKEFVEETSYRLSFALRLFSLMMFTLIFYFISRVFSGAAAPHLQRYNGDYFSFVFIGLAFSGFFNTGLNTFSAEIRSEQVLGTLETLLTTRTPLTFILSARLLWKFLYDSLHLTIFFAAGGLFLHAEYTAATAWLIPLVLALTMVSYASLGLISAGFILILKRGDPLTYFFSIASQFLGGVYFPVSILPEALQKVSVFLPITYSLRLTRDILIRGAGPAELARDLAVLALLSAALFPLSVFVFSRALRRTRVDGSLTHY